jgi:hypothetical protein
MRVKAGASELVVGDGEDGGNGVSGYGQEAERRMRLLVSLENGQANQATSVGKSKR